MVVVVVVVVAVVMVVVVVLKGVVVMVASPSPGFSSTGRLVTSLDVGLQADGC